MPFLICPTCHHRDHATGVDQMLCTSAAGCTGIMTIDPAKPGTIKRDTRTPHEREVSSAIARAAADSGNLGADSVSGEIQRPPSLPPVTKRSDGAWIVPGGPPVGPIIDRLAKGTQPDLTPLVSAGVQEVLERSRRATPPTLDLQASGLVPPAAVATVTVDEVGAESCDGMADKIAADLRAGTFVGATKTPELWSGTGRDEDMQGLPLEALNRVIPFPPTTAVDALRLYLATCAAYPRTSDIPIRQLARDILIGNLTADIEAAMARGMGPEPARREARQLFMDGRVAMTEGVHLNRDGIRDDEEGIAVSGRPGAVALRQMDERRRLFEVSRGCAPPGGPGRPQGHKLAEALEVHGKPPTETDRVMEALAASVDKVNAAGAPIQAAAPPADAINKALATDPFLAAVLTAAGAELDVLGNSRGMPRAVDTDEEYRARIQTAVTWDVAGEAGHTTAELRTERERINAAAAAANAIDDAHEPAHDRVPENATLHLGDAEWHDGAGWYYVDDDYPDDGSVGAFATAAIAVAHARLAGYSIDDPDQVIAEADAAQLFRDGANAAVAVTIDEVMTIVDDMRQMARLCGGDNAMVIITALGMLELRIQSEVRALSVGG